MSELDTLRRKIRDLDRRLLELWKQRDEAARNVGKLKQKAGLPLQNFEVEKAVLEHALRMAHRLQLSPERTAGFVRLLIESALAVQERDRTRRAQIHGRKALVVGGAGLMGSWFARFLEEQGFEVFVEDPKESPYPKPKKGAKNDVVIVATPPSTVLSVLEAYGKTLQKGTLLMDIASVKGDAARTLRKLAAAGKKVASIHPMFGPSAEVLMGRNVLVLDCGSKDAVREARALFAHTAARTHVIPVDRHDALMADVLGLSHATSLAFNEALVASEFLYPELEPVASTTFRKQAEVSREVARENPRLYYEIQTLNQASLDALRRLEASAAKLRVIVQKRDEAGFAELMRRADAFYQGVGLRSR